MYKVLFVDVAELHELISPAVPEDCPGLSVRFDRRDGGNDLLVLASLETAGVQGGGGQGDLLERQVDEDELRLRFFAAPVMRDQHVVVGSRIRLPNMHVQRRIAK